MKTKRPKVKKEAGGWLLTMARRFGGTTGQKDEPEETSEAQVLQIERGPATVVLSSRVEQPVRRSFLKFNL
jgi:hypothetical protein